MEMRAVRDGSALKAMGMQTGDVARSVNGITLDTPDGLIGALRAARESDSVTIAILRDGQASELRYTID
jgi:type II secretory pathway component PulC